MTENSSSPPTGIPEASWNTAILQAKLSDKPFLIKRFDPTDNSKTYVFFGHRSLPLRLAMPMMVRLFEPLAMRKRNRDNSDVAIRDHLETFGVEKEDDSNETVAVSGYRYKNVPKTESFYGLVTYVRERYEDSDKHIGQPTIISDFLAALRAK